MVAGRHRKYRLLTAALHKVLARFADTRGHAPDGGEPGWDDSEWGQADYQFRSLTRRSSNLVSVLGPDGVLRYQSPSVERVLGYKRSERIGRSGFGNIHPDDAGPVQALFQALIETPGGEVTTECRIKDAHGIWRWFEIVGENMLDVPHVGGVVANYHEITDRKALEERLRYLVEGVPAIVYTAEAGPEATWTYVSPQIEPILGFTPAEWMSDPTLWWRRLHPDDRQRTLANEQESLEDDKTIASEYRMIHRDGHIVWLRDEAVVVQGHEAPPYFQGVLVDVTDRKRVEEALGSSEKRFRTIFDSAPIGVNLVDLETRVIESNRVLEEMLGYGAGDLKGLTMRDLTHPEDQALSHKMFRELLSGERDDYRLEKRYLRKDGTILQAHLSVALLRDDKGAPEFVVGMIEDITARKELEKQLRHQAFHDPLTDAANRALLEDRIEQALARIDRKSETAAVLLVDLDNFKAVNDSFGHAGGDQLLVEVASRLRASLRPADTVARLGGDEFAVLLTDVDGKRGAIMAAERILSALGEPVELLGDTTSISVSVGIAMSMTGHQSPTELLRNADVAMYMAKGAGKGRYEMFEEGMVTLRQWQALQA